MSKPSIYVGRKIVSKYKTLIITRETYKCVAIKGTYKDVLLTKPDHNYPTLGELKMANNGTEIYFELSFSPNRTNFQMVELGMAKDYKEAEQMRKEYFSKVENPVYKSEPIVVFYNK